MTEKSRVCTALLSRRQGLAFLGTAIALPYLCNLAPARHRILSPADLKRLALALGPLPSVSAIGRAYLRERGGLYDDRAAAIELTQRLAAVGADVFDIRHSRLTQGLAALIESDLNSGRQTSIAGWIVAQSEADIGALYLRSQSFVAVR